jgi:excisionase family DNA binding protein
MDDLLTTRQVMELLKVNRITIYRMLNDGRLKGVKIGQQWRFARHEVEHLLGGGIPTHHLQTGSQFPTHCLQIVQDVCANLAQVSAFMIDMQGNPLTDFSNPSGMCGLLHETSAGLKDCQEYFRQLAGSPQMWGEWTKCHAGLSLVVRKVSQDGESVGLLLSGQCCLRETDDAARLENFRRLQAKYKLDPSEVSKVAQTAPQYNEQDVARIEAFPDQVVKAVESILHERSKLAQRLQHIAEISTL